MVRENTRMALAPQNIKVTPADYINGELKSDVKHEYDNGYIVAMVGASRAHNLIALTLASEIKQHLKGKSCRTYISDMKVRIQSKTNDLFYYPDVMISCDSSPPSEYYEDKPIIIIEVLSPTTETRDKLEKLSAYASIPSLKEYFTVSQEKAEVHRYSISVGATQLTRYVDGDLVELESIGLSIPVREIYAEVAGGK